MAKQTQNKTQPTKLSVKDFLSAIKHAQRRKDAQDIAQLMRDITEQQPVMWGSSIVGFGKYHYKYESGREGDMCAIGFSPRKTNLTIYLVDGPNTYAKLLSKLGPHSIGKACLYIKKLSDINMNVLKELIKNSYKYVTSHKHEAE